MIVTFISKALIAGALLGGWTTPGPGTEAGCIVRPVGEGSDPRAFTPVTIPDRGVGPRAFTPVTIPDRGPDPRPVRRVC